MLALVKRCTTEKLRGFSRYCRFLYNYKRICGKCGADNVIAVEAYVKMNGDDIEHNNWGDDINKYFFEFITQKKVIFGKFSSFFPKSNIDCYLLIGSILNNYDITDKFIYGSGIIDPNEKVVGKPKRIYSVRGPKSRKVLLQYGIECPEAYGDPALLLPIFYKPHKKKTGRGCVIAHKYTPHREKNMCIKRICDSMNVDVINMDQYDNWTDVVDKIVNAEFVLSESLHGLVVAETYGVPCVWIEMVAHEDYWDFKFEDFYESISKEKSKIKIYDIEDMEVLNEQIKNWKTAKIDYDKLLKFIPFSVVNDIGV